MAEFTLDLTGLHPAVAQGVIRGLHFEDRARYAMGLIEQRRLKQLADKMAVAGGFNNEVGRMSMVTSEDQAFRIRRKYGQLCFLDPDFGKWLLKKPEGEDMKVRDVRTKIQTGWTRELEAAHA